MQKDNGDVNNSVEEDVVDDNQDEVIVEDDNASEDEVVDQSGELAEGMVEIELLKDHGNCKAGCTRIVSINEANVLCSESAGVAKIIRE